MSAVANATDAARESVAMTSEQDLGALPGVQLACRPESHPPYVFIVGGLCEL